MFEMGPDDLASHMNDFQLTSHWKRFVQLLQEKTAHIIFLCTKLKLQNFNSKDRTCTTIKNEVDVGKQFAGLNASRIDLQLIFGKENEENHWLSCGWTNH